MLSGGGQAFAGPPVFCAACLKRGEASASGAKLHRSAILGGVLKAGRSISFRCQAATKRHFCAARLNRAEASSLSAPAAPKRPICAVCLKRTEAMLKIHAYVQNSYCRKKRERSAETHIPLDFQSRTSTCTASKGIFLRQGIPFPRVPIYACSFHTRKPLGFQWKLMGVKVTREFLPRPRLSKRLYWQAENYASAIAKSVCLYGAWAMSFAHESHKAMRISILNIPNLTFF